jgi:hypothetical protein
MAHESADHPEGLPLPISSRPRDRVREQSLAVRAVPVTAENFTRAETDMYFSAIAFNEGGFGRFAHHRDLPPVDSRAVVRFNRDVLASGAIFDLDAGPVTVTLPDPGERFLSMLVIDEDHYVPLVAYGAGTHTFTKDRLGTRYMMAAIRIMLDPFDPKDIHRVHALQDAVKVKQWSPGRFEIPNWDRLNRKKVRQALFNLGKTLPDLRNAFGAKGHVDPIRHLVGTAMGWGGSPDKEAYYLNVTPLRNNGATTHVMNVKHVPVDAFWSLTVYNADGYFEPNDLDAYCVNSITAKKDEDGSVTIRFGECDGKAVNCLPIMPGWNYLVRLYRPRPEILDGSWTFPAAQPAR